MPVPMWLAFILLAALVGMMFVAFDDLKTFVGHEVLRMGKMMGASQEAVNAVVEQLGKAKAEILAEIASLEAAVAAGEPVDLSALVAAAQGLDDIVPDAVEVPVAPVE